VALRAQATIDLGAVRRNAARLADAARGARLCAVVKADGYGHGAVRCARAAIDGGASWLAVATAGEAAELRPTVGAAIPILVMGALGPEELRIALDARADLVAWEPGFVAAVGEAAPSGDPVRVHVKFDTGMGRLGTRSPAAAAQVAETIAADPRLELAGAMTHFATADEDSEFMAEQLERFAPFAAHVRSLAPEAVVHAANSAGTLRDSGAQFDLVRCGIALYGLDPFGEDPATHGLEPALTLRSYLAAVKPAAPGESTGYGRRFIAERPTWIGTAPIGYGDGAIVGNVSMDNITVDLGPEPLAGAEIGAPVTLIGPDGGDRILAEELARWVGTINYEIVTGISGRVPREYAE
jgi:alanine racemase